MALISTRSFFFYVVLELLLSMRQRCLRCCQILFLARSRFCCERCRFISRFKHAHRVVFLPIFCFLVIVILVSIVLSVLFMMALISPRIRVFLCSLRVVVLMRQRCLRCWQILFPISFFKYIYSGQNRLWDVMPCVWSLVFFSSLVHLSKFIFGPLEKESRVSNEGTTQVFIPLISYLLESFVSSSFPSLS